MIIGGKRERLIGDNLFNHVKDNLDLLGWFDSGRQHSSVTVLSEALSPEVEAQPNLVAIALEDSRDREWEMGSNLSEHNHKCFIDVYGESDSVVTHLAGDIKDIIAGRFLSIGQSGHPRMTVQDLSLATPVDVFTVEFDNLRKDRSRKYNKPFEQHWIVIGFDVIDFYTSDQ